MGLADITRASVEQAIAEADSLGQEVFLAAYGFAGAKRHWLVFGGVRYPSKAIVGAAHKYVSGASLRGSSKFKGGERSVVRKLRELGFEVESTGRNPAWTRDELILAMDLYFDPTSLPHTKGGERVVQLSELLNAMRQLSGMAGTDTFRNPEGVYLKLMNLRSLDAAYIAQGKVGMTSGGTLEKVLWSAYEDRLPQLRADAQAIRDAIGVMALPAVQKLPPEPPYEGEEGGVIIGVHKRYERDPKLIAEKRKAAALVGPLVCEVCSFSFQDTYGDLGAAFIEVHHTKPVAQMAPGSKTKLTDLALLCSNCHRMAHRRREPLDLDEIRSAMNLASCKAEDETDDRQVVAD